MSDILVVNSGSSSLKYQLIDMTTERTLASGLIERIGERAGRAVHTIPSDEVPSVDRTDAPSTTERELPIADHVAAFGVMLEAFEAHGPSLDAASAGRRRPSGRARRQAVLRADGRRPIS